jgi:hypothetical protein
MLLSSVRAALLADRAREPPRPRPTFVFPGSGLDFWIYMLEGPEPFLSPFHFWFTVPRDNPAICAFCSGAL